MLRLIINNIYLILLRLRFYFYRIKTNLWYRSFLKRCGYKNTIIAPMFLTPGHIVLEDNILIWNNARIEGVRIYQGVAFHPEIYFMEGVTVQQNLHLTCANKVSIGRNTAIAANVTITDIDHPYLDISVPIERQKIKVGYVCIKSDCKIYNNVVILPNVTIGNHSVVGANSVVRAGIYPDYSIIVGNPARIVKRYCLARKSWVKTDKNGDYINE